MLRIFDAAVQRHFQGKKTSLDQISLLVEEQQKQNPANNDLTHETPGEIHDLSKRASELLEMTDSRLGISPDALVEILRAAIAVEGQGSLEEIAGRPGFYRLKPPPRWEGLARQTLTVGSRTDRMELVFDAALVEEEINNRRVMRIKKHQVLLRLGHPIMRQAMATLCRQLHDPEGHNAVFRWSVAALRRTGFEALMVFHYTLTGINELREPLHDEVMSTVLRIEGDRLVPVEADFEETVLHSDLYPLKSTSRLDDWLRTIRGHWFQHKTGLEELLRSRELEMRKVFQERAKAALSRELEAAKESYRYRLKELQDRSREQEIDKLARQIAELAADAQQGVLFEEIREASQEDIRTLEEQREILRQDIQRTRDLVEKERDHRTKVVLPKRFQLREVRVLPLGLIQGFPSPDATVLCEPSLARTSKRPPDVVLVDTIAGIHVIEVKAHDLAQIEVIEPGGQLRFRYENGTRTRNPVAQVRSAMFDIKNATEQSFDGELLLLFKYWVAFPNIKRSEWMARWGADAFCPPEFLFAEDMDGLADRLLSVGQRQLSNLGMTHWSSDQIAAIWKAFGDSSVLYHRPEEREARRVEEGTLGELFDEAAETYKTLSEEQQKLSAQNWHEGPRLIRGVAGSGKTIVLANNLARRLQRSLQEQSLFTDQSPRLLVVCNNRSLVPFLEKKIALAFQQRTGRPLPEKGLDIFSHNRFLYHLSQKGLWRYQRIEDGTSR